MIFDDGKDPEPGDGTRQKKRYCKDRHGDAHYVYPYGGAKLNADTLALLKKCVGHVKLGIVRDGVEMVVSIDKQTKEQRLGLGDAIRWHDWQYPCDGNQDARD